MRISVARSGDVVNVRMRLDVHRQRWLATRISLGALAVIGLFTGAWAVLAPGAWFRSFPGFGLNWVAMDGAYNEHLAVDAGAFFLGLGAIAAAALWYADSLLARVAGLGWLVFGVPHLLYHALHYPAGMNAASYSLSLFSVVLLPVLGGVALFAAPRERIQVRDPAPISFRLPPRRKR
ncbi:hypothetical protein [Nocardia stercoris]|uniref:DUF4383 domain-containing protein n=1 Tax=Nocardia stercoris TaxID=2483361 RepID=A0A3M2L585_9NOCA|nr:hypothetical protein [Nocardia stercoris]RMI32819.1 hypothetical protein EBN03_12885 [Nocardia stercoris]